MISFSGCEGCGYSECISAGDHIFEQNVVFEPQLPQYHIGDTIQAGSMFSCMNMLNTLTGLNEDFCGLKSIESTFHVLKIDHQLPADSLANIYAFGNFDFQILIGSLKPYNFSSQSIFYELKDSDYGFKLLIIPKVVGKYAVFISDCASLRLPGGDPCDNASIYMLNGNSNNHIELLEAYSGQGAVSEFEKTHVYCLEVIP